MAKFILLDHSLFQLAGHHYSYAVNVLRAAETLGDEIVLATHVNFQPPADLPGSWRVLRVFTRDAYTLMESCKALHNDDLLAPLSSAALWQRPCWAEESVWRRWQAAFDPRNLSRSHRRQTRRRRQGMLQARGAIEDYAQQCEQVFQVVDVDDNDAVFIPTLTAFDLEPLVSFLRGQLQSRRPTWHLQFHFNFLQGREPDYAAQDELLAALRKHFAAQLDRVVGHRIFLYTTARPLAEQYARLGVGTFEPLPYPVDETLQSGIPEPDPVRPEQRSLRVTYAGGIRPEKGSELLESVIQRLWTDYFAAGRLQFLIQVDLPDFAPSLPDGRTPRFVDDVSQAEAAEEPVVCVRAPLSVDDYARLIGATDIGLLLYQSERYYTRASGVLVELLGAGVPVIVPAGCWLSAQIAEQIYSHLERMIAPLPVLARERAADTVWRRCGRQDGKGGNGAARVLSVPPAATHLVTKITWPSEPPPGVYARLNWRQIDRTGRKLHESSTVLEQRDGNQPVPALLPLEPGAATIELTVENAFHSAEIQLANIDFSFVTAAGRRCPAGAVGLIAADQAQVPALLADITENFEHYRATAAAFARHWKQEHLPLRTIERLKRNQRVALAVAAGRGRQMPAA